MEQWIIQLLELIKDASKEEKGFTLSLNPHDVQQVAKMYEECKWIEIY